MTNIKIPDSAKTESLFSENRIVCEWLSSAQVAAFLAITENALRIMVYRRQIKFAKLGRRLRFHVKDVQALLFQRS